MIGILLAGLIAAATILPTPSATPSFSALPTPTPTAETLPGVTCVMAGDQANCQAVNLIYPRQLTVDGLLIGTITFSGPFTIAFAPGSGAHRITAEGFAPILVTAP